ncbi:MAG TPA: DUF839 domain-containing protein [Polyangiaceae bacterium]|nr:DUF839 domain-containing protein [Polyangiaceae bacterium]
MTAPRATSRRDAIRVSLFGAGMLAAWPLVGAACKRRTGIDTGPLLAADGHGVRLPPGYRCRVVARSGRPVAGYRWHGAPDGGATFATEDGGYIYVSNSELEAGKGGVSALRFDSKGETVAAYRILGGTTHNCAGGASPWGTWLSCEEHTEGLVWECDPLGKLDARPRPALGAFKHEAVAVDMTREQLYMTEDEPNGRLYRFTTKALGSRLDLDHGRLEVARVDGGHVRWLPIPDPSGRSEPTREQQPESQAFNGGEGIVIMDDVVHFATKGDNRVWSYDIRTSTLRLTYDATSARDPMLTGVDNLCCSPRGELVVAEDAGDMQLVAVSLDGSLRPLLQIEGHDGSEITGPAFDPSGRRLYFSSQRGATGRSEDGVTYEVTGPFFG